MYELTIKDSFASAHYVREQGGQCENLHGHTWRVEVTVEKEALNEIGMVIDFKELKNKLKEFLGEVDHSCLNDHPYFETVNPTTENMAKYIFDEFNKIDEGIRVKKVQVWESDTCSASYSR